jgi:hypothetical protein
MYIEEIQETSIWQLYEKGRNYHRRIGIYTDTDRNYRMYNGNQWEHANLGGIEPTQQNFIKPIVKYKVSVIHDNLYAINYSSLNFENRAFRRQAERYCKLLNGYAARIWEQDKMDYKGRRITKDSAINDEGILYVDFDQENMKPVNEIVKKNDIYYGNENDDDIQNQPYILIRKRMPVSNAVDFALSKGMSEDKTSFIIGDNDNFEESGEAAKDELDNMCTIVYKMYKKDGTVHFSISSRYVDIAEDVDTGLSIYPVAHFVWEEKEGSARGEGEVRYLIPNQIEVNRTLMRRVLTAKSQAYPYKVVDITKISNPDALDTVGGTLRINSQVVDDVHKIVATIPPAQMSPDVEKLQQELINVTRDLAGAGDTATGQVDPEAASGRAILAVQQASQAPMTEQKESYKNFVEDVARIWLEYLVAYSENGINMEEEVTDEMTGQKVTQIVNVPQSAMEQLQATVKIDVTPKSVYDRFAQERTIENLFVQGMFSVQRLPELKVYVRALDDDSVAPKLKLEEIVEDIENEQRKIAMINAKVKEVYQRANQFLMGDPDEQSSMMADAQVQLMAQQMPEEAQYAEMEAELDEEAPVEEE